MGISSTSQISGPQGQLRILSGKICLSSSPVPPGRLFSNGFGEHKGLGMPVPCNVKDTKTSFGYEKNPDPQSPKPWPSCSYPNGKLNLTGIRKDKSTLAELHKVWCLLPTLRAEEHCTGRHQLATQGQSQAALEQRLWPEPINKFIFASIWETFRIHSTLMQNPPMSSVYSVAITLTAFNFLSLLSKY